MPDSPKSQFNTPYERMTPKGIWFTCRGCGHEFWDRFGLIHKPCPKCGQHVGHIEKATVKYGS